MPIEYVDASVTTEQLVLDEKALDAARVAMLRAKLPSLDAARTAHLKGFTSGLVDCAAMDEDKVAQQVVDLLVERNIRTLVWDGDDFGSTSYTALLPTLQRKIPQLQLVAVLMQADVNERHGNPTGFKGSWSEHQFNVTVLTTDNKVASGDRYEWLGVLALRATGAKLVVALGGGMVLRREYDNFSNTDVEYLLIDVVRTVEGNLVASTLCGLKGVETREAACGGAWAPSASFKKKSVQQCRPVKVSITVMNLIAINAVDQTFTLQMYAVHWACDKDDDWTPVLEWRNLASYEEQERVLSWADGYRKLHLTGKWIIYQPMDLHTFPFDSHKLEITLISNSVTEVVMSWLSAKPSDAASFHPQGDKLLAQAQWRLECTLTPGDPITTSFLPTNPEESKSRKSYARMNSRICVHRKWQFMIWNLVMPTFLLGGSTLMQYTMDQSVADRLAFDFTLLLSVLALKLVTVGMLPSAPYLTYLDMYMLATYLFIVGVAAETAIRLGGHRSMDLGTAVSMNERIPFCCAAAIFALYNGAFVLGAARTRATTTTAMMSWLEEQIKEESHYSEAELSEMSSSSKRKRVPWRVPYRVSPEPRSPGQ